MNCIVCNKLMHETINAFQCTNESHTYCCYKLSLGEITHSFYQIFDRHVELNYYGKVLQFFIDGGLVGSVLTKNPQGFKSKEEVLNYLMLI